MATLVPTLATAVSTVAPILSSAQAVSTIVGSNNQRSSSTRNLEAQQQQALVQLQERQAQQQQQLVADNALERERIAASASAVDEERRAALRRATARQRAQFGASGITPNSSGSAQAVLLGLFEESEGERAQREEIDNLRTRALDLGESQRASVNVLQRTQLQERQRLDREIARSNNRSSRNSSIGGFIGSLF